jgi:hypothetical protein
MPRALLRGLVLARDYGSYFEKAEVDTSTSITLILSVVMMSIVVMNKA